MVTVTKDTQATVQRFNKDPLVWINNFQAQLTTHSLLLFAFQISILPDEKPSASSHLSILNGQFSRAHTTGRKNKLKSIQYYFIWIDVIWNFFWGGGCFMGFWMEFLHKYSFKTNTH